MPCADTDDDVAGTAVGATIWVGGGGVIMLLLGIAAAAAPSLLLAAAAATASPSWTRASWSFNGLDISAKEEKKKHVTKASRLVLLRLAGCATVDGSGPGAAAVASAAATASPSTTPAAAAAAA